MTILPFLLSVILFASLAAAAAASSPPLQLLSLLAIKSSLIDPQGTFQGWNLTKPDITARTYWCSWAGVQCDRRTSLVTGLDLSGRNLSGDLPADVRHLSSLASLNLSHNSFSGPLPAVIFDLANLTTLDLNHNQYISTFPSGISKLKSLKFFTVYSNNFTGPLPEELVQLKGLEHVSFGGNYFEGEILSGYGELRNLTFLYLSGNRLTGRIPAQLGFLDRVEHLELGYNSFDGGIPPQFSNLSSLLFLDISQANLSGHLPGELGRLKNLRIVYLFLNSISGPIPPRWAGMKSMQNLDLSDNQLSGEIPSGFSDLRMLNVLSLMNNNLSGEIPQGIGELPYLQVLNLWNNSLSGILPQKLGSNARLQRLDVSTNSLSGPIPPNLCPDNNLERLLLFSNEFSGPIPTSITNCTTLFRVRIHNNNLSGSIPARFGFLPNLTYFELSNNRLSGPIPDDLGNAPSLEFLNISENAFRSPLPDNIWNAPSLQIFAASSAGIIGKVPDFGKCLNFYDIELAGNDLNGSIPWNIGHCEKLISLDLSGNSFSGIIPWEISTLPSITEVDLSRNLLTGAIPSNFNNCTTLESFNVSYNQLTGPIPSSGLVFTTLHPSSFAGNKNLCGPILNKPCGSSSASAMDVPPRQPKKTAGAIVWIMAAAFGVGLFILIAGSRCFQAKYNNNRQKFSSGREIGPWRLTAFQRLNFTADDILESLNVSDEILGMGSTGTVYKAEMPGGEIIAVKQLWGKNKESIMRRKGVLAEVEVLGNVRHRNIVRLLGCCSNNQCTMLLYEYMPNGSLDDLLHGKSKVDNLVSDWVTRYKIALGVAQGICYLHHDCDPVIVHRDLKPGNILLDGEMEARVADFGVAKLIQSDESMMSVIAGSYGYIAPEYAYTLQVDEKSDIYSYGVVLMEILTGKRSVDSEFGEGNSIVDWVKYKMKTKGNVSDLLDKNAGASCASVREEMLLLLKVALLCTSPNPADRPSMRDVLTMLHEAKPTRKLPGSGMDDDEGDFGDSIKINVEC